MKQFALSKVEISSFVGDVLTLSVLSEEDLRNQPIRWSSTNEAAVRVKRFSAETDGFFDRVLITLLQPATAVVTATLGQQCAECRVEVRPMLHADSEDVMQYYIGDMHAHTGYSDGVETPDFAFQRVQKEGQLNFSAVSDHGVFYTPEKAFQTQVAAEENTTDQFIPLAAQEADLYFESRDDYGLTVNQGGELLVYQGERWAAAQSWDEFFNLTGEHPALMLGIPHPSDVGGKDCVIWNGFNLPNVQEPRAKKHLRFVEVLNSPTFEAYNLLHERIWSQALDYGYRVCATAGSDTHSWNWGVGAMWSRTVVLAPTLSREAILDAMLSNRVYTTESGNVKLNFQVNGVHPGGTVPAAAVYLADFNFDVFHPANENERIVRAELFSDYGEVVDKIDLNRIRGNYTLCCRNAKARYLYLRLTDAAGDRTWSAPIWTENKADQPMEAFRGLKIPRTECVVLSADEGDDAEKVMNGNPNDGWHGRQVHAEIVIDTGKIRDLCAMGYYHHYVAIKNCFDVAQLLARYEIEVSQDNVFYESVKHGSMRSYGGEQIIRFPQVRARYIKFIAISSVGADRGTPKYENTPVAIGELSVYQAEGSCDDPA